MNNRISYSQVIERLHEHSMPHAVLALQNNVKIVISEWSGRVLGPFLSEDSESVFWTNSALADAASFTAFRESGGIDLGGERMWIAPEIQYNVQDRNNFDGSYRLPAPVDPGQYALSQCGPRLWCLEQDITLQAYNVASGQKRLHIERMLNPAHDPLRGLSRYDELVDGVIFAGYEQTVTLSEAQTDAIASQSWLLIQVNPGGVALIPFTASPEATDYYEPVGALQSIQAHHVRLNITGQQRYKTGYKAACTTGRLGYFNRLAGGRAYLIVRCFFNNPSTIYAEEPAHRPGFLGDSIHVYNDSGALGGFGELECAGQTIGGPAGKPTMTDQFLVWLYVGPDAKIDAISRVLLGIELDRM